MPLGGSLPLPPGLLGQGPTGTFLRARLQRTRGGSQGFSWGNPARGGSCAGSSASWRYSSRLTGSAGLASKGLKKRATCPPRHLVRSAGAVGDSKEDRTLLSDP